MDTGMFTKKELDIRGSRTSSGEFPEAIDLIMNKKIPVELLISRNTHSFEELAVSVEEMSAHPERFVKVIATF